MRTTGRALLVWAFGGVHALMAATAPENTITVEVLNGPFAGTTTVDATGCPHVKDRDKLGCGWKAFSEHTTTKALEEAGIEVDTVSAGPGARTGDVVVKFLEANGGTMHDYSVSNVPLTLTRNGGVQQISFDGKTKEGVRMRVTATIVQVDEF